MLLEQLAERHRTGPAYDWNAYYRWYFRQLNSEDCERLGFWFCEHCLRVNLIDPNARYGTCPSCQTIHPRFGRNPRGTVPPNG
jgi:hypothetical protein